MRAAFFAVPEPGQTPNRTEKGQPVSLEKRIADLTAAIKKSGLTTGKATIAAQEMVTEAEKRFGANSDAVLDAYQPGQNPRQFLNGFQNAYILGTLGKHTALQDSKAAAYLTQEQREIAYSLGTEASGRNNGTHSINMATESITIEWPTKGTPISREEYKLLMQYARGNGIELAGFKHFDGDIETVKTLIDDAKIIADQFPWISDGRRRPSGNISGSYWKTTPKRWRHWG